MAVAAELGIGLRGLVALELLDRLSADGCEHPTTHRATSVLLADLADVVVRRTWAIEHGRRARRAADTP